MDRFVHALTHVRIPRDETDLDEYGQPAEDDPVETAIRGLVQPRSAREMDDDRSAGAEVADHVIFLPLMDLAASDAFEYAGERYQVLGIRRFEYGRLAHLEVDARRVAGAVVGVGS